MESFGDYIKRLRNEKGLNQTELAGQVKLDGGGMSKVENDKKTLNEEEYHKKIERKLNDLVIKIEKGELTLDDLSKADQKVISRMLEERK